MKDFYIVSADSGRFLRSGQVADNDLASQRGDGELLFEGTWPLGCDRINMETKEPMLKIVTDEESRNELARAVKARRNDLLRLSDWTQLADVSLTGDQIASWTVYRQALRDISLQVGYPESIVWPLPPQ